MTSVAETNKESNTDNIHLATGQEGVLPAEFYSAILAEMEVVNNNDPTWITIIQQTETGMDISNNVRFVLTFLYFCLY